MRDEDTTSPDDDKDDLPKGTEVGRDISPRDLPKDHPGRRAAEEKTGDHGDLTGSGN